VTANSDDAKRFQRYQAIVYATLAHEEFRLNAVKEACSEVVPGLVTRVVRRMADDGLLEQGGTKTDPQFRWCKDRSEFDADRWIGDKIFNNRITQSPTEDRPRERLLAQGASKMRTAELLAILIRVGREGESALQAGERIAARFAENLENLPDAGRGELREVSRAITSPSYCQIMAGIELGRRVERAIRQRHAEQPTRIRSSADALDFCRREFGKLAEEATQEHFQVVCLDTKHQVIDTHTVSMGLLNQSLVAPREVFRHAIRDAAAAVILSHNHPSGDPTPSREDVAVTRRLEQAAELIGINVLDHIIVARNGCISLREYESDHSL
jgi:DNA repair protein RadC